MKKRVYIYICIVLSLDQISKYLASNFLDVGDSLRVIKNFFYISNTKNYGAAWGIFEDQRTFLIIISVIALVVLVRFLFQFRKNNRNSVAFGLLFGGLLGNFIDRVFIGYVRDFIDFKIFSYDYPVFNISDICIVVGVILLIYAIYKGEDKIEDSSNKRRKE